MPLVIHSKGKSSKAYCTEVVNICMQSRPISRDALYSVRDNYLGYLLILILAGAVVVAKVIKYSIQGWDTFELSLSNIALLAATLYAAVYYVILLRRRGKVLDESGNTTLTLDENGVTCEQPDKEPVHLAWRDVASVRLFRKCLAFLPGDDASQPVFSDIAHADQILAWMQDNKPEVKIVR